MGSYRCDDDKDIERRHLVTYRGCLLCICEICLLHVSAQRNHLKVNIYIYIYMKVTKKGYWVMGSWYMNEVPIVQLPLYKNYTVQIFINFITLLNSTIIDIHTNMKSYQSKRDLILHYRLNTVYYIVASNRI